MQNIDFQNVKENSYKLLDLSNQQICDILIEAKDTIVKNIDLIILIKLMIKSLYANVKHLNDQENVDILL